MISDYFKYALENLAHRRLRSWLTIVGIMIGIAAVVSLVSLGRGLSENLNEQFAKLGGDKIIIQNRGFNAPGAISPFNITKDDLKFVRSIPGIAEASGLLFDSIKVEHDGEIRYVYLSGLPTGKDRHFVEEVFGLEIEQGRLLRDGDRLKVALGYNYMVENSVFKRPLAVGDKILVDDVRVEVVGFYKQVGNPDDDRNVYMTADGFEAAKGKKDSFQMILARVAPDKDPNAHAKVVQERLRRFRGEDKGKETFFVQTFGELIEQFTVILVVLQGILFLIAFISLVVGAIGIMNTMYTAVLERTREIGVMKSVGAKNSDIFVIFLIESGFLGLVGGILGVLLGYGLSVGLAAAAGAAGYTIITPYFPWWLIVGTLLFAFVTGAFSGSWPAWQASKLNPVEALRYE